LEKDLVKKENKKLWESQ